MKIELITRVAHPALYRRMQESAKATAHGTLTFSTMLDDGQPRLAESYNLLASMSKADIFLFLHDDIIFLSPNWDDKIRQAIKLGYNTVGVVGTQKYTGGLIFDSGKKYSVGMVAGQHEGQRRVKLMTHRSEIEPCQVVDGMFMAVERRHFFDSCGFDLQFDGLFYYDVDFCLKSKCVTIDALVSHEKPQELYGVYPKDMKPIEYYRDAFNSKHGFKQDPPIGDQSCDAMLLEDYLEVPA